MNQPQTTKTPTPVRTSPAGAPKGTPPQKDPNPSRIAYRIIFISCSVIFALTIIMFIMIGTAPETPSDSDTSDTTAPVGSGDPSHEAVTYPTTPSRDSYLLSGNGTAIDGSTLSASSAILVSLKDFSVTASIGADERIHPASMTKIMTLIVACEEIEDASVILTITSDVLEYCRKADATVLAVDPEDRFTATDMLYSVGVVSAADACITLANHIAGSEEAFVALMNEKAASLGLTNTRFVNSTGLDDEDGNDDNDNYSTVRDMAVILAYALDNPFCRDVLSTDNRTVIGYYLKDGAETTFNRQLYNTLWSRLEGAGYEKKLPAKFSCGVTLLGGKTGYTDKSKYCLASFLEDENGVLYITVTAAGDKAYTSITDTETVCKNHT